MWNLFVFFVMLISLGQQQSWNPETCMFVTQTSKGITASSEGHSASTGHTVLFSTSVYCTVY